MRSRPSTRARWACSRSGTSAGRCRTRAMTRTTPRPERSRVLVAGGGVAALEATIALRDLAPHLVDVELLAPEHEFWYRPLAVAEPFGLARVVRFELADVAASVDATFSLGALVAVDADARIA